MQKTNLVFKNANVISMDIRKSHASLVAVSGDRIGLVGDERDLDSVAGVNTRVIDCEGKTLVPGFNDAHCHIFSFVHKLSSIDLSPPKVKSITDIKAIIHQAAQNTPKGQWIIATDYNDFYLAEKRHPNRWDIDEIAPEHPVMLTHRSLHACVLNSRALSLAGITTKTEEPPGAMFERDNEGEITGVLFEMVGYMREKVIPPLAEAEIKKGIHLANREYLSQGITSLQDATIVNDLNRWNKFQNLKNTGNLKSRIYMMPGIKAYKEFIKAGLSFGAGDENLRLGSVKIILSEATGRLYPAQEDLNEMVFGAHKAGFQVAVHAVRPTMIEAAINAIEYAQKRLPRSRSRHRIEHCAECPPPLLERIKQLQMLVVTQPAFLYYSGERYLALLSNDELQWLYRFKSLIEGEIAVAASSDSPLVPVNPIMGIYAAVHRQTQSGQSVLPDQRISAYEALRMYTLNAAYASFEEGIKGSITPGKLADLVLLSADLLKSSPEEIKEIMVEMTIIGGEVVWQR